MGQSYPMMGYYVNASPTPTPQGTTWDVGNIIDEADRSLDGKAAHGLEAISRRHGANAPCLGPRTLNNRCRRYP